MSDTPVFNPFAPVKPVRKPLGVVINTLLGRVSQCARTMVTTYLLVQKDIHQNEDGYTEEEIIEVLGPRYATLVEFAILDKTISNRYQPKTIEDTVPEALIVLPTHEKFAEIQALLAK